jgi:drug/metabolite transporter (DMT)-like permease
MTWRIAAFVLAAVAGVALFAWGGAHGIWPLQIAALALVLVCLVTGWRWLAQQHKPPPIKPAADPAWSMREQPAPPPRQSEPPAN